MPIPDILVNSDDMSSEDERPAPLVNIPSLNINNIDGSDSDNDSDAEDVMTAEEEAAARRYLNTDGNNATEQRRMSSLDMYLLQAEVKSEPMIINRRRSLKIEEQECAKENSGIREKEEEAKHQEQLRREREEVKKARECKQMNKETLDTAKQTHSAKRSTFRKHGLGGMGKERRKKLKEMILLKAKEEIRQERLKELSMRDAHIKANAPLFEIDGLNDAQLIEQIKSWYQHVKELEEQKFEWEIRLRRQDEEINDLAAKLCAMKGHYQKPILRKVPKPMGALARLDKIRTTTHLENPIFQKKKDQSGSTPILVNGIDNLHSNATQ